MIYVATVSDKSRLWKVGFLDVQLIPRKWRYLAVETILKTRNVLTLPWYVFFDSSTYGPIFSTTKNFINHKSTCTEKYFLNYQKSSSCKHTKKQRLLRTWKPPAAGIGVTRSTCISGVLRQFLEFAGRRLKKLRKLYIGTERNLSVNQTKPAYLSYRS